MKKILLYTYNPFGHYKKNAGKELVKKLHDKNLKKVVLDTNYNLNKLYKIIKSWHPDIILGIGQSFGKTVKVERVFRNLIKNPKEKRIIAKKHSYITPLPVKKMAKILKVRVSENAGTMNCNFSTYALLSQGYKAGFIHIPSVKYFSLEKYLPRFQKILKFIILS